MTQVERIVPLGSEKLIPYACGISRQRKSSNPEDSTEYRYNIIFPGTGIAFYADGSYKEFAVEGTEKEPHLPQWISEIPVEAIVALTPAGSLNVFEEFEDDQGERYLFHSHEQYDPIDKTPAHFELGDPLPGEWIYDVTKITFYHPHHRGPSYVFDFSKPVEQ